MATTSSRTYALRRVDRACPLSANRKVKVTRKSKSPRSRRVSPEASAEPPSGFEPETYALRAVAGTGRDHGAHLRLWGSEPRRAADLRLFQPSGPLPVPVAPGGSRTLRPRGVPVSPVVPGASPMVPHGTRGDDLPGKGPDEAATVGRGPVLGAYALPLGRCALPCPRNPAAWQTCPSGALSLSGHGCRRRTSSCTRPCGPHRDQWVSSWCQWANCSRMAAAA